jgi:ATP-dependent protease HslVU (ClpYQ) peptidase subunit
VTCIVGVKTKGGVLLGGDSLGSDGSSGMSYQAPKVFRLTRQVAAGMCGSFRMGQLLQHHVVAGDVGGDELKWAITNFVPAIRDVFSEHGYAHIKDNEETGGTFLLAVRDRLFKVQDDYSVLESRKPYDSCGSGEDFALGAMHALWKNDLRQPRKYLTAALDAASEFAVGVAAPYHFTQTIR